VRAAIVRRAAAVLAGVLLAMEPAGAALLPSYRHTAFTLQDGAPAQIGAMAQTRDGWLWLGTVDGLYRFDGVAFERVNLPQRGMLGRSLIYSLHAEADGSLLISHRMGGLSRLRPDGSFADLPALPGGNMDSLAALDTDAAGQVWALGANGVYALSHGAWRTVADGAKWKPDEARSLLRDQAGTLWASFDHRIWRLDSASGRFVAAGPPGAHGSLMQAPDGAVWAARGERVVQVAPGGAARRDPRANQAESRAGGQFDRDGNLWKILCPVGACLLPAGAAGRAELDPAGQGEHLVPGRQIAGVNTAQVLEDREGNVWIATESGLNRYQRHALQDSGLVGSGTQISLAADADGAVWAADANDGSLWRLQAGSAPVRQAGQYARAVGVDRAGALLLSGRRFIERRLHGVVTRIALPPGRDGKAVNLHVAGTLDDGKVLWMAAAETGLMGYVDGKWQPRSAFNLPPKIVISSAGAPGQLWLADGDGGLTLYDSGKLTRYDASMAGFASAVFAGNEVMVAGDRGLAVLQHGAMRLLRAQRPGARSQDVLRNITGMAVTPDGDRWFNGAAGVVHVRAADWQRALAQPQALLQYRLLDTRDGYPGQAANMNRLPSVVQAAGGQLWFAATGGVVRLETRSLQRNLAAPTVQVQQVSTVQASYAAGGNGAGRPIALPPASANFSIAWSAPALRRPEQLRYTYRLEGVDTGWRDGAASRTASYTNVGPGTYRFRVRVANEDGTPGTMDAVQAITVAPTILQSAWFKALCALSIILLCVAGYRYRIRMVTARLVERMQVRTSERERIARTLHDTYLQSVHALLLRVGATAQSLPGGDPTRATLETALADAGSVVAEGRGQVEQLRAEADTPQPIEALLAHGARPLQQHAPGCIFAIHVDGAPRTLAPHVRDEAGQIGMEALRNAFGHADARRIDVHIDYGAPFTLTVRDDGRGLDAIVREQGYRSGHWGLLGMRERARSIGARLDIDSARGAGTTIRLSVPRAYRAARPRWLAWWPGR
jgi:signal transduction histidine kinase